MDGSQTKMTPERACRVFVQTARNGVKSVVENEMIVLRTGKGREIFNNYTGKTINARRTPYEQVVLEKLQAAGLTKDEEFLNAVEKWLKNVGGTPMFHLFTALDGEGAYAERDIWFDLHAKDIGRVPANFHDSFYPIDGDLLKD